MASRINRISFFALTLCVGLAGCETAPKTSADKNALTAESQSAVTGFTSTDPSLHELMNKSVGYAIFPDVGKAGFIAGGAYGRGEVFEGGRQIGFADLSQGSIGLQAGAQTYDELVLFMTSDQLSKFKGNQFTLNANLSAVIIKSGAAGTADYSKGVVVFVRAKGGAMAEASVGGQRFTYTPTMK